MSIKAKNNKQLSELRDTLINMPHINEVHFTKDGDHFFEVHELNFDKSGKKGLTTKKYGFLRTEIVPVMIGNDKKYKHVNVHTPESEVVETLSREEILIYAEKNILKTDPLAQALKEIETLKAQLIERNAKS
jgi:hypothetical protein